MNVAQELPIDKIKARKDQPRKHFDTDALAALAASIRSHGIIQPLVVAPAGEDGQHTLVAGERRLRAAKTAGLKTVPATISDGDMDLLALIENVQRQDLGPIEKAQAFQRIMRARNWTQRQLGEALNVSRETIGNSVRLLDGLPEPVLRRVADGRLGETAARELLRLDVLDRAATAPPDPQRHPQAGGRWAWLWAINMTCSTPRLASYAAVRAGVDHALAGLEYPRRHGTAWAESMDAAQGSHELNAQGSDFSPTPIWMDAKWLDADLKPDFARLSQADLRNLSAAYDRHVAMLCDGIYVEMSAA
jgi:ParB/RepB/Spo0J family partition protein